MKKVEKFQNKIGIMGCIWSSLNAPGIKINLCHPILELGESHFSIRAGSEWNELPMFLRLSYVT